MEKARIYCEVTCCICGALASESGYYRNKSTIAVLKKDVAKWAWNEKIGGNICPKCLEEEKNKR